MILGIIIISFLILACNSVSCASSSGICLVIKATSSLTLFASSIFFSRIKVPIWLLIAFLLARNSSAFIFTSLSFSSNSITSSTNGSLASWNFFFIFSFTISGFWRKNLISIISFPPIYKNPYI